MKKRRASQQRYIPLEGSRRIGGRLVRDPEALLGGYRVPSRNVPWDQFELDQINRWGAGLRNEDFRLNGPIRIANSLERWTVNDLLRDRVRARAFEITSARSPGRRAVTVIRGLSLIVDELRAQREATAEANRLAERLLATPAAPIAPPQPNWLENVFTPQTITVTAAADWIRRWNAQHPENEVQSADAETDQQDRTQGRS